MKKFILLSFALFFYFTQVAAQKKTDITLAEALQSKSVVTELKVDCAKEGHLLDQIHKLLYLQRLELYNLTDFPTNLVELSSLIALQIRGSLDYLPATQYHKLTSLRHLAISANIALISENFGKIPRLETLYLAKNKLKEIPLCVFQLQTLTKLNLDENPITQIPQAIGNLINLKELSCDGANLTAIPPTVGNLSLLERLSLESNKIKVFPIELCNLNNIKIIDISENKITKIPKEIAKLNGLEALFIVDNPINDLPNEIIELKKTYINISGTKIKQKVIDRLSIIAGRDVSQNIF
ncbi:MAG: leucine-rich repeat domain-containing protein [Chitinophagaceae bacterium]|nr:leucine-rich repeat domain-containing protein [Chitinophagaceae bacterium]